MFRIPPTPLGLVKYAFRALSQDRITLQELCFFISFGLGHMSPSRVKNLIKDLSKKGSVILEDGWVTISPDAKSEPLDVVESVPTMQDLGTLLKQYVSSSRLSRAVGLKDSAIELHRKSVNPLKIEGVIHGSRDYDLILDEGERTIGHNCPDWRRVSVIKRFCKHVAKVFLLLEKEEALRLLASIQHKSWQFVEI